MTLLYAVTFIPPASGLFIAALFWLLRSPQSRAVSGAERIPTVVGMSVAVTLLIGYAVLAVFSFWVNSVAADSVLTVLSGWRFAIPIVLGIATVILLAVPIHSEASHGSAELSRRTPLTFVRPWWFIGFGALILVALGLAGAAGSASHPDAHGNYTLYSVHVGSVTTATTIYGWFYSVPCLILFGVLLAATAAAVVLISRPPLALDREKDTAARRRRSLNVASAASGAVLFHVSAVLLSLAGTSSLSTQVSTGTVGEVAVGSSFAALTVALQITSYVTEALGFALWFSTFLSVIPAPLRARRSVTLS